MKKFLAVTMLILTSNQTIARDGFFNGITNWLYGIEHETDSSKHMLTDKENHIVIKNFTGDITIKTWNKNEVLLETKKIGTPDDIEETRIDIKHTKTLFSIKTVEKATGSCCVDYTLVIPKRCSVDVQTEKGNISITNVTEPVTAKTYKGSIKINGAKTIKAETKYGNIDIEAADLKKTDKVLAFSTKGNVRLSVPENTNATLYAKTSRGKVTTQQKVLLKDVTTEISKTALAQLRKDIQGSLGKVDDGCEVRLYTDFGNVKVVQA